MAACSREDPSPVANHWCRLLIGNALDCENEVKLPLQAANLWWRLLIGNRWSLH